MCSMTRPWEKGLRPATWPWTRLSWWIRHRPRQSRTCSPTGLQGKRGNRTWANATFLEYLSRTQEQVGLDQQDALSEADFQAALLEHLQAQQQSVSGVSIDEEMVDLIKFQQIYQAAAKVITHAAEMLDTAIQMVD